MKETVHLGDNIRAIRELKGIKQETFAEMMGVTQAAISKLESTEKIDDERLKDIADKLGVSVNAMKRFNADAVILHFENVNSYDSTTAIKRFNSDSVMLHIETVNAYDYSIGTVLYNLHSAEKISDSHMGMLNEKDAEIQELRKRLGKK